VAASIGVRRAIGAGSGTVAEREMAAVPLLRSCMGALCRGSGAAQPYTVATTASAQVILNLDCIAFSLVIIATIQKLLAFN